MCVDQEPPADANRIEGMARKSAGSDGSAARKTFET
jgi:hypothetical protein